jgi:hypothetical protein
MSKLTVPTNNPHRKTKLPDIYAETTEGGDILVVANKKARFLINKWFDDGDPLPWDTVGGGVLTSPRYLAIEIGRGPVPQLILAQGHQHGLLAMFKCISCPEHHVLDDATAARFLEEGAFFAEGVHIAFSDKH